LVRPNAPASNAVGTAAEGAESRMDQCVEWPSSLLLVANRMATMKTMTMTGTTKKGEVMCMVQAPCG